MKKGKTKRHPHKTKPGAPTGPAKASPAPRVSKVSPPRPRPIQTSGRFAGTPYRCSQVDYAETYGKSLPTIKRWWKEGKPLDDADAMGDYLSPRGRKPEETDDEFEAPSIVATGPDPLAGVVTGDENPVTLSEEFFQGEGILAAIERLKKAERERGAAYLGAIVGRQGSQHIQNRFKEWVGVIEILRKLAKDEPGIRKANDLTVDKSEMEAGLGHIFNGFRVALRNVPPRVAALLEGRAREHDEIVELLENEIEVVIRTLVNFTIEEAAAAEGAQC